VIAITCRMGDGGDVGIVRQVRASGHERYKSEYMHERKCDMSGRMREHAFDVREVRIRM
jgi:hypothetical protein